MSDQQTTITVTAGEVIVHEDGTVSETRETREVPMDEYLDGIRAFLRSVEQLSKEIGHD